MANLVALVLTLFLALPTYAKEPIRQLSGAVTAVADGDTVTVISDGSKVKVRLYGIDAPETEKRSRRTGVVSKMGQPYGEAAKAALTTLVAGKTVYLDVMAIDRYKRTVSVVRTTDGKNVNMQMVRDGWAWAYRQYLDRPHASEYLEAEEQARNGMQGLWRQPNPQPPWEFRKLQRIRGR